MSRREAERLIEHYQAKAGSFLVRDTRDGDCLGLSVLEANKRGRFKTKHYRINEKPYFLSYQYIFNSLDDLLAFYISKKISPIHFKT